MKFLLTGATGFLGGRIARELIKKGHEVVTFKCDILNLERFRWFMDGIQFDGAIHTVGLNDAACKKNAAHAYNVNVTGTHNLLASLDYALCRKVLYLSTIHVYGYPALGRISEDTSVNPLSDYAMSHYLAEEMVLRHPGGTVVRLSNGWGAPANPETAGAWVVVVNSICRQAIEKKEIELFLHEDSERNFVTASDISGAVAHLMSTAHCGVFNVGSDRSVRIVDMAYRVADRCEALYGFRPAVKVVHPGSWEFFTPDRDVRYHPSLNYRIDKLRKSGFTPAENVDAEIDDLLRMVSGMKGAKL